MINLSKHSGDVGTAAIANLASDQSTPQARLVAAMEEVMEALAAGQVCDREALLAKYRDVAEELSECLSNLDFVQNVAPQLADEATYHDSKCRSEMLPHDNLGDFRILREVGRGGMGVVYEAEQISLGRRVALKVLPFAAMLDRQQLTRFKNEARAAATLDHPNIVSIYSVGSDRGVHYYAMQLIEGQSLAQMITTMRPKSVVSSPLSVAKTIDQAETDNKPPTTDNSATDHGPRTTDTQPIARLTTLPAFSSRDYFRTIAQLGIQAAEALDHAHQNGVLHRDIKPANLLLECHTPSPLRGGLGRGSDDAPHLKLWITDFGLARIEQDAGMTMTGDLLGTLRYMSPEQALAKRVVVDHRSDIYSLGVTLYELLTLQPAYSATDRQELLRQIAFEDPRNPRQINARIPQDLETILLKAIEKNPADRYTTSQEVADDLRRFLGDQPVRAKRPRLLGIARKWSRRHRLLVWTASLTCAAFMLISMVALSWSNVVITRERNEKSAALQENAAMVELMNRKFSMMIVIIDKLYHRIGKDRLAEFPEMQLLRDETIEQLTAQTESNPHAWGSWFSRGAAHVVMFEPDKALSDLTRAIELDPQREAAWELRGDAYKQLGQYDKAVDDFTKAIALNSPSIHSDLFKRGVAYWYLKRFNEGIADFNKLLERDPQDWRALVWRGKCYNDTNQVAAAVNDFTKALEFVGDDCDRYEVHWRRADALDLLGRHHEALDELEKAFELKPKNPELLCALAWHLAVSRDDELRDGTRAVQLSLKACELTNYKNANIVDSLGASYAEHGDFESAIKWAAKAVELASNPGERATFARHSESFRQSKPLRYTAIE